MDLNEHVYCTLCQNFGCKTEDGEYILFCPHSDDCDFYDTEDSKPFKDRPFYKSSLWIGTL